MAQVDCIDVASYQSHNTAQLISAYNPGHVIVRAYLPWEHAGYQDISRAQVDTARAMGKTVGVYCWPYDTHYAWDTLTATIDLCNSCAPPVIAPLIWLDCEESSYGPGPDAAWLRSWFQACDDLETQSGLYVRRSWIDQYYAGGQAAFQEFAARPLWLADHDGIDNVDIFTHGLPVGWTQAAAKQWGVTQGPAGACDRNVIRPEYTIYGSPNDPCESLREQLATVTAQRDELAARMETIHALSEGIHDIDE